jgi:hypothetical protein
VGNLQRQKQMSNVKITVIGDLCANKTQFTKTYQTSSLYLDNILGESSYWKAIDLDGRKMNLNIHDISRQEGNDYVRLSLFVFYLITRI